MNSCTEAEAVEMKRAAVEKEAAMQQAGIAPGYNASGREQSYAEFALEGAAAVTRTLDSFYPGGPFVMQSRPLTRSEKIAALRAAIVAYEHLPW